MFTKPVSTIVTRCDNTQIYQQQKEKGQYLIASRRFDALRQIFRGQSQPLLQTSGRSRFHLRREGLNNLRFEWRQYRIDIFSFQRYYNGARHFQKILKQFLYINKRFVIVFVLAPAIYRSQCIVKTPIDSYGVKKKKKNSPEG